MLRAFGVSLAVAGEQPPGAWREQPPLGPELALRQASAEDVEEAWSGRVALGWEAEIDGAPLLVEVGEAGDHRFVHGAHGVHHLSADGRLLLCAPASPEGALWWRVVLDSVLFSAALLRGREALHAGAVAIDGAAVAITASAGGGKSTLLAELLARGARLVSDDVLVLEGRTDATPLAHPGPPLMTLPAGLDLGEPIVALDGERWAAVPTHPEPLPLTTIAILDRRSGLELEVQRLSNPFAPLIGALLRFPRTPEREVARLSLASSLAVHTAVWRLSADSVTPAAALADKLIAALADQSRPATLR